VGDDEQDLLEQFSEDVRKPNASPGRTVTIELFFYFLFLTLSHTTLCFAFLTCSTQLHSSLQVIVLEVMQWRSPPIHIKFKYFFVILFIFFEYHSSAAPSNSTIDHQGIILTSSYFWFFSHYVFIFLLNPFLSISFFSSFNVSARKDRRLNCFRDFFLCGILYILLLNISVEFLLKEAE
jgi:hypothetical protein